MVANNTGIPANLQHIIFRGIVLKDDMTLKEQKGVLDGGSVGHVVSRPPDADAGECGDREGSGTERVQRRREFECNQIAWDCGGWGIS